MSRRRTRRSVRPLAAVPLAAALLLTGAVACSSEDPPERVLQAFLDGWPTGDLAGVPLVAPTGSPLAAAGVADEIAGLAGELHDIAPDLTIAGIDDGSDLATAQVTVSWPLSAGDTPATWDYQTTVRLSRGDGGWRVIWEPAVVHPDLTIGDTLAVRRTAAARADILDAAGGPLVTARPVVDVGIWPARATDLDSDLNTVDSALRSIGVTVDLASLRDRVDRADPDHFVPVVTLRQDDFASIEDRIGDLDATTFRERERHLAPSRTFARAVLGIVDEVTAEVIQNSPGVFAVGDQVGFGGLSERYDAQLRGGTGHRVLLARTAPDGQVNHTELFSAPPRPGIDLRTTLDVTVQAAAEAALHTDDRRAALVAVRISDGAVLAVANTHGADANPVNLAFTGAVPPGSTFKMVSAYGLLAAGDVAIDTIVDCPQQVTVDGRTFRNAGNLALGEVPFRTAVADSCNTPFAALAPRLGDGALAAAGAALGIGGDWSLGLDTFTGQVSDGADPAELAAASFGQGTTRVSPAAMAAATAAVARGAWLPPNLVATADPAPPSVPLDAGAVADLHTALRAVVTDGTAGALAGLPGGEVYGKTGSAEVDDVTHGWFIGWRDDLAFAVFVEGGGSGSGSAVPLVEGFLRTLG
jgi:cell division protein FtsI/penicillin-binding protein 2